jgi:hypothetical protein
MRETAYHTYNRIIIIIISLLMPPLLGQRPSIWITHKENGPEPTTRAQWIGADWYNRITTYIKIVWKSKTNCKYKTEVLYFLCHPILNNTVVVNVGYGAS